jgi:hypothetical protein
MGPSGRVLVIDMLIAPGADGRLANLSDLMMMAMPGGRERTESEFRRLFASLGLRLTRAISTGCPPWLMEGVRA